MSPSIGSARHGGRAPGPPRDRAKARLLRLYNALRGRFGPPRWGPGRSPWVAAPAASRLVGAIRSAGTRRTIRRILARHRLIHAQAGHEEVRAWLETHLPSDPQLLREFHALLAAVGKSNCRLRPRCEDCGLRFDLRGRHPAPD